MLTQPAPPSTTIAESRRVASPAMWRVAGGLALAHVVLLFAGFSQEVSSVHGDTPAQVGKTFLGAHYHRVLAGGYVESLAFIVLLPALVFVSRMIGQRTEVGRWAATTGLAAGTGYVAATLAVGFPAGAAALYGVQHGADLGAAAMIVDIRNYAFFLSILLCGAQALAVGIAAIADRRFTRWVGYGGVIAGTLSIVGVAAHFPNIASMFWILWWIGVGVCLIRAASRTSVEVAA